MFLSVCVTATMCKSHEKCTDDNNGKHVIYIFCFSFSGVETPPSNDSVRLEPGPLVNGAGVFYVAATLACALILVVGSVGSALYIRNSKARVQESQ